MRKLKCWTGINTWKPTVSYRWKIFENKFICSKMCTCYFFLYGCAFCNKHHFYLSSMMKAVQWTLCFHYIQNNHQPLSYSSWTSGIQNDVTNIKNTGGIWLQIKELTILYSCYKLLLLS